MTNVQTLDSAVVPCSADLHWQEIVIFLPLKADTFLHDQFRMRMETITPNVGKTEWIIGDAGEQFHSHIRISEAQGSEFNADSFRAVAEQPQPDDHYHVFDISTVRIPVSVHETAPDLTHKDFFSILSSCLVPQKNTFVGVTIDLSYSAAETRWRLSLLADAPQLGELDQQLGTVAISGLSLSFQESGVGLRKVNLDTNLRRKEYRVGVVFAHTLTTESLHHLYDVVSERAETLAALFVAPKSPV